MRIHNVLFAFVAALPLAAVPNTSHAAKVMSVGVDSDVRAAIKANEVKLKLLDRFGEDALGISVSVSGEVATLSGTVESAATRGLAQEVALSVDGIHHVFNQVLQRGNGPSSPESTVKQGVAKGEAAVKNAMVELKVKSVLLSEIGANAFKITVEAYDGVVSLRGTPDDTNAARAALKKVKAVSGVTRVVDLLD